MVEIQKANVGQVNLQHDGQVQEPKKEVGDDKGVIAKGVGVLKKMWLHLTGKAGDRHSQQLTNLRSQVKTKFGDDGLKHLNETLRKKGFTTDTDIKKDTSTKLLSDGEIKSLMGSVEVDKRVDTAKKEITDTFKDPHAVFADPKMREIMNEYGKSAYVQENIDFLKDMTDIPKNAKYPPDDYLDHPEPKLDPQNLRDIVSKYVGENSSNQVNIPDTMVNDIEKADLALVNALETGDRHEISKATDNLLKQLRKGQGEIFKMTDLNIVSRPNIQEKVNKHVHDLGFNQVKKEVLEENLDKLGLT